MKAVLIIDMPNDCYGCPCYYEDSDQCEVLFKKIEVYDKKPSWCPLRPLPHKLQADWYTDGYKEGFNACLAEITGETE